MKKVYCKNCKYNGGLLASSYSYSGVKGWKWCEAKVKDDSAWGDYLKGKEFTGLTGFIKKTIRKSELNHEGNCSYYKRSWYKFWVK